MRRVLILIVALAVLAVPAGIAGASSHVDEVAPFPTASGPEGVAVDHAGNIFVSVSNLGEIWRVDPTGGATLFYVFDNPGTFGLAFDDRGRLYAAHNSAGDDRGVWRITRDGRGKQLPGSHDILFPNAIAFDDAGYMYVTESVTPNIAVGAMEGSVWRFAPTGARQAQLWYRDVDTLGGTGIFGDIVPGFPPVGANGIAYSDGAIYVANSERGLLVEIPIEPDGSAGVPTVPVSRIKGLDGIAFDADGMVWAARVSNGSGTNAGQVLRIDPTTGKYKVMANAASGLRNPASVAFGTAAPHERALYVTNFAIFFPGEDALLRVDAGIRGQ